MTIDNTLYLEALKKGDLDYFHKLFNAVADSAVADSAVADRAVAGADEKKMSSRLELSAGIAIANKHFDLARFFVSKMDLPETEKASLFHTMLRDHIVTRFSLSSQQEQAEQVDNRSAIKACYDAFDVVYKTPAFMHDVYLKALERQDDSLAHDVAKDYIASSVDSAEDSDREKATVIRLLASEAFARGCIKLAGDLIALTDMVRSDVYCLKQVIVDDYFRGRALVGQMVRHKYPLGEPFILLPRTSYIVWSTFFDDAESWFNPGENSQGEDKLKYLGYLIRAERLSEQVEEAVDGYSILSKWLNLFDDLEQGYGSHPSLFGEVKTGITKRFGCKVGSRDRLWGYKSINPMEVDPLSLCQKAGLDLSAVVDEQGNTLLHHAVRGGYWLVASRLLDLGANPNLPNKDGVRLLTQWLNKLRRCEATEEEATIVQMLIASIRRHSFDLNFSGEEDSPESTPPIFFLCNLIRPIPHQTQLALLPVFLEKRANIVWHTKEGDTYDLRERIIFSYFRQNPEHCFALLDVIDRHEETLMDLNILDAAALQMLFLELPEAGIARRAAQWLLSQRHLHVRAARRRGGALWLLPQQPSRRLCGLQDRPEGVGGAAAEAVAAADAAAAAAAVAAGAGSDAALDASGPEAVAAVTIQRMLRGNRARKALDADLFHLDQRWSEAIENRWFHPLLKDEHTPESDAILLAFITGNNHLWDQSLLLKAKQGLLLRAVQNNDRDCFNAVDNSLRMHEQEPGDDVKRAILAHLLNQEDGEDERHYIERIRYFFEGFFTDRSLPASPHAQYPTVLHQWLQNLNGHEGIPHPILFEMACAHSQDLDALFRTNTWFGMTPLDLLCEGVLDVYDDQDKLARLAAIRDIFLERGADFSYAATEGRPAYKRLNRAYTLPTGEDRVIPKAIRSEWLSRVKPSKGCVIS